jgi:hypothetical protein
VCICRGSSPVTGPTSTFFLLLLRNVTKLSAGFSKNSTSSVPSGGTTLCCVQCGASSVREHRLLVTAKAATLQLPQSYLCRAVYTSILTIAAPPQWRCYALLHCTLMAKHSWLLQRCSVCYCVCHTLATVQIARVATRIC